MKLYLFLPLFFTCLQKCRPSHTSIRKAFYVQAAAENITFCNTDEHHPALRVWHRLQMSWLTYYLTYLFTDLALTDDHTGNQKSCDVADVRHSTGSIGTSSAPAPATVTQPSYTCRRCTHSDGSLTHHCSSRFDNVKMLFCIDSFSAMLFGQLTCKILIHQTLVYTYNICV